MYKNHNMLLLILFALNGLFAACTSADKANTENSVVKVETVAEAMSTPLTKTDEVALPEAEVLPEMVKGQNTIKENIKPTVQSMETPKPIKVKVDQPAKVEAIKEEKIVPQTTETEPVTETPIDDKANEEPVVAIEEPIKEHVTIKKSVASHADFNALLQKHVKNGLVNYEGFEADDAQFDAYLDYLSNNAPSTSDTSNDALAFWMNAYNAFTIKLIVDNLPVASIMDLDGGKVWDRKWINIGGKTLSLNGIEHDIIRPVFNEPRIHFAVVCAAKSCPPLDNKAFMGDTVDAHLERLTKSFINNPKFNTITESKVAISPIMDWYGKDFGNVLAFVQKYATTRVSDKAKVKFTDYDWSLNEQ